MGRHRSRSRSPSGSRSERSDRHQKSWGSRELRERDSRERGRDRGSDRRRDSPKRYRDNRDDYSRGRGGRDRDDWKRESSDRARGERFSQPSRAERERERGYRFDSPPKDGGGAESKTSNFSSAPTSGFDQVGEGGVSNFSSVASPTSGNIPASLSQDAAKAARELYVGNLPPGLDVNQLVEFLNAALKALSANIMPGNPATKSWISSDNHYAFVEFRSIEEATKGMCLNGLNCLGYLLRVGRPKTFPTELANFTTETAKAEAGSESHADGAQAARANALAAAERISGTKGSGSAMPDRLCIMNMPDALTEERVKELVTVFGSLRFFEYLQVEGNTCILEYEDVLHQQQAIEAIDQLEMGRYKLSMCKAEDAIADGKLKSLLQGAAADVLGGELMLAQVPTRVLMLSNIVLPEELRDDKEFEEIVEDVKLECMEYGHVMSVEIPRPMASFDPNGGHQSHIGYAYVEFTDIDGAGKARKALSGRKFSGRTVEAHYYSERLYQEKSFETPCANYQKEDSSVFTPELAAHVQPYLDAIQQAKEAAEAAARTAAAAAAASVAIQAPLMPALNPTPAPLATGQPRIVGTAPPVMPAVVPVTPMMPSIVAAAGGKGTLPPLLPLPTPTTNQDSAAEIEGQQSSTSTIPLSA